MRTMVWCKFRIPGFHNWPDAPDQVAYLRGKHRHEFHFQVYVEVGESNREIEFIQLKQDCIKIVHTEWVVDLDNNIIFGAMSCEMIGEQLLRALERKDTAQSVNKKRQIIVEVSEDGENGGFVSRS